MRRAFRRGFRGGQGALRVRRAHQLLEQGDYFAAAEAFEELAPAAEARGGPRAPMLFLQAGRARILAGQVPQGLAHLKTGLQMLAERGRWARFQRVGQRAVAELRQQGLDSEAKEVLDFIQAHLPQEFDIAMPPALARRPLLPTHCASCGAVVEPDEVEWLDEATAECDYCGSPIRAQQPGQP